MPVLMKALRSFRGEIGEGVDRYVDAGSEFSVELDRRAEDYERHGLAVIIRDVRHDPPLRVGISPPENKAALTGPLALAGGEIGEDNVSSSSDQVRQPRRRLRRSENTADDLDL